MVTGEDEWAAMAPHVTRRMVLTVPVTPALVEDVAQVLRTFRPNLAVDQSLQDALTLLNGVNEELLKRPVYA